MTKPIVMSWDLVTRASLQETWKLMSDTDRFNRVAEAGFTYAAPTGPSAEGGRSQGSIKKLGMTIGFDELPFSFRAPNWFRIERRFHSGPAERLVALAKFTKRPEGGTRIEYTLEITPRGFFSRAILGIDLGATTQPRVDKALRLMIASLDQEAGSEQSYAGIAPQLTADAEKRLAHFVRELKGAPNADRLASFLRAGPERDQARIAPSTLANAWRSQLDEVTDLLLSATNVGMLSMTLDLLCPACLVPRRELGPGVDQVHCESCNIKYDASFPELLVVHFRPSPQIRTLDVKLECLGSPAQSSHILSQETLAPGEECDLGTDVEPGMLQIRTLPALGPPAFLEVSMAGQSQSARFTCKNMIHPQMAKVSSPRQIHFKNSSDNTVTVVLERVTRPAQMVTAGRLYAEYPRFRELAPVLPFFSSVHCYRAAVLSVTAVDSTVESVAELLAGARFKYVSGRNVLAIYGNLGELLTDAGAVGFLKSGDRSSFAGVSVGMIFDLPRNGQRVPMGPAVDDAYSAMQGAGAGNLAIASESAHDTDVARALASREVTSEPHGFLSSDGRKLFRLTHA